MDPVLKHYLWDGCRRHQPSVHLSCRAVDHPVRWSLVGCGSNETAGVLRCANGCRDGDDRVVCCLESVSLFHFLGAHARSRLSPHRCVGWSGTRLRRRQVFDFHTVRQRADAGGHHCYLSHLRHAGFQGSYTGQSQPSATRAGVAVRGLSSCVRGEGSYVSGAYVASQRPYRGSNSGKRYFGRNPSQNGRLRFSASVASDPSVRRASLP